MSLTQKIVLGTVQFGVNYGINNRTGQVTQEEASCILWKAYNEGIRCLDTSAGYGNSEEVLGEIVSTEGISFKIVSKYLSAVENVTTTFDESLHRLRINHLYGYLIHHFEDFQENPSIWEDMLCLKRKGKVDKIGFSLYNVSQLQYLLDANISFDILQFPYNIFDRQFESYFPLLKRRGVEIHTRSCFLQGLFFKDTETLPIKLLPLKKNLEELHNYCSEANIPVQQLALNYVVANPYIDGVLIGVDSCEQLEANLASLQQGITQCDMDFVTAIEIEEKELLNPVNWK